MRPFAVFTIVFVSLVSFGCSKRESARTQTEITFENCDAMLIVQQGDMSFESPIKFDAPVSLSGSQSTSRSDDGELQASIHVSWTISQQPASLATQAQPENLVGRLVAVRINDRLTDVEPPIATGFYIGEPLSLWDQDDMKVDIIPIALRESFEL